MNNLKKIGLTALVGSLTAVSAQAAEMAVSGTSTLTYTSRDTTEVTGNPMGMNTSLGFTASGEVNGYTVSYMVASADQFAGMTSARLSVDMGDLGTIAFDQGSGSGLATIDDKTPTAAEEIWDGIDGTTVGGLVGTAGSSGVFNYVNTVGGLTFNAAARSGSGTSNIDGATSGTGGTAYDLAVTGTLGDALAWGTGFGVQEGNDVAAANSSTDDDHHSTIFANYSMGPVTFGYQFSNISNGAGDGIDEETNAWGIAFNVNDNLSISYGEREVEYQNPSATNIDEEGEGIAIAYTMGSIKLAGNRNEVNNNNNTTSAKDQNTEIALSFAF